MKEFRLYVRKKLLSESNYLDSNIVNGIIRRFQINPEGKIGEGTFGVAYRYGGLVLKITEDKQEAILANHIKHKKFKYIANIESVFKIKGSDYFVIILEYLEPLNNEDVIEILSVMHIVNDSYQNRKQEYSSFSEFLKEKITDGNWWNTHIHEVLEKYDLQKIIEVQKVFNNIVEELKTANIPGGFSDIHPGNMGTKNGNIAVYDIRVIDYSRWRLSKIKSLKQ